ncbi:MAG: HAMP domain-containing protein [Sterolibacterium sp.]|nr:HAMP domain-containing protein [Sterolibacterium sp.]
MHRIPTRLLPHSLLWRTFLLVALLMLLSVLAWFAIFRTYQDEPRARQMTQLMVSVVNLTRSAIINAAPENRRALLRDFSDHEGIHIYPAEAGEKIEPLQDEPLLQHVATLLHAELGAQTRLSLMRNGESAVFINFTIGEGEENEYWVALPRKRIEHVPHRQWIGWGLAALLLSLCGAYMIVFRITRPLRVLAQAASDIGRGRQPPPIRESGPNEIVALAHAFNQMSTDLARLDSDRALILAGISHDLRTPLTRLRMEIEMALPESANANTSLQTTRDGMIADIEEMDQTINQFLDFARENGGETPQQTDLAGLLEEITALYARRSVAIITAFSAAPPLQVRQQTLRRAITNLIDNALRYAKQAAPDTHETHATHETLRLALYLEEKNLIIEIADRGPGIPEHEVDRLKQPFTRLETARSNVHGAGLGLAIVDRIARNHGGCLQLRPREGGGLVARIVIPASGLSSA